MATQEKHDWLPERLQTPKDETRRVGVEIELAGLRPEEILEVLQEHFDGEIQEHTLFEYTLKDSQLGDFTIELDAAALKELGQKQQARKGDEPDDIFDTIGREVLTRAA